MAGLEGVGGCPTLDGTLDGTLGVNKSVGDTVDSVGDVIEESDGRLIGRDSDGGIGDGPGIDSRGDSSSSDGSVGDGVGTISSDETSGSDSVSDLVNSTGTGSGSSSGSGSDSGSDSSSDRDSGSSDRSLDPTDGLYTEGGKGISSGYNCLVSTTLPGDEGIVGIAEGAMLTTSSSGSASSGFAQRHSAVL